MKNYIKSLLFSATILFSYGQVSAQGATPTVIDDTMLERFRDFSKDSYKDVEGKAYLFDDWSIGTVKVAGNGVKKDINLKYDEVEDRVLVKGTDGVVFVFASPVMEFAIVDPKTDSPRRFKAGFAPTKYNTSNTLFEVLYDGKIKFLKKNIKVMTENKAYSGAINKRIVDNIKYYIVGSNNEPVLITTKNEKSILGAIGDKSTELSAYIKDNKLNLKNDTDVIKLISYYEEISKK